MLITFFDIKDIIHVEFILQGQIVNRAYYVGISKRLHEAVHRKWPELWPNNRIMHHDNAPDQKELCQASSFWYKNRLMK
jgi:hypothetical protein